MRSSVPFLLVFFGGCPASEPPAPTGPERITVGVLQERVHHLASDAFNGRETGTDDIERAAAYLDAHFRAAGLQPLPGDDDLYADYTLFASGHDAAATTLSVQTAANASAFRAGVDFKPFSFSDPGAAEGPLVFAGYGISAPDEGWDDYAGLDVTGKIVLILRYHPLKGDENGPLGAQTPHAAFTAKAKAAADHGAAGFLLVTGPRHQAAPDDLRLATRYRLDAPDEAGETSEGPPFRAAQISRTVAEQLVAGTGQSLEALQDTVDAGTMAAEIDLGPVSAKLEVAMAGVARPTAHHNVIGMLPGASKPDEWVVVGAHYDHVGGYEGEGDTVFNGADDNASGTVGLMTLVDAFTSGPRPARSMVFMAFSGEEKGLLGSRAWVRDHGADNVVFMLNLDMIGRNPERPIELVGDGYGTSVGELATAAAAAAGLADEIELGGDAYAGNSDHHPFYEADVPFLFFFTGTHDDYHQVGDHADKVAYDRMAQIVTMGFHLLDPIAQAQVTPQFIHHVDWLGAEVRGLTVADVTEDSRGAKAGLQPDDRLVRIGEDDLAKGVGPAFRAIEPGSVAAVVVKRGDAEVSLEVTRVKRGYLGVFPGDVPDARRTALGLADGAGVWLREVVDGGPAATSGLRNGDVVVEIAGQPVAPGTLGKVLQHVGAGETVPCVILRGEDRHTVALTLGERPTSD